MNAALLREVLAWLTLGVDQRPAYFAAPHAAQLEDDYRPFGRFIVGSMASGEGAGR